MDMTGERRIPAPRQVVWDALNDTATLKAAIPGCESLEKTGDNQMKATAAVKLGPISARFNGAVPLLVRVKACDALVVPTAWLAKLKKAGVSPASGAATRNSYPAMFPISGPLCVPVVVEVASSPSPE